MQQDNGMNNQSGSTGANARSQRRSNSLSQAMNKLERNAGGGPGASADQGANAALRDAMSRTGGAGWDQLAKQNDLNLDNLSADQRDQLQNSGAMPSNQAELDKQREEIERKQKYEQQRRELHKKVNPVEQTEVFNAREAEVEKKIESLRQELKLLAKDVKEFNKEIDMTLMDEVKNPGQDGTYYINFFEKLKKFIILLRKRIKSARTWAQQMQSKKKKKKKKKGPGLNMEGASKSEKTTTVHDMMNSEVGGTYGSG